MAVNFKFEFIFPMWLATVCLVIHNVLGQSSHEFNAAVHSEVRIRRPCLTDVGIFYKLEDHDIIWINGTVTGYKRDRTSYNDGCIIINNLTLSDGGDYVWICGGNQVTPVTFTLRVKAKWPPILGSVLVGIVILILISLSIWGLVYEGYNPFTGTVKKVENPETGTAIDNRIFGSYFLRKSENGNTHKSETLLIPLTSADELDFLFRGQSDY